MNTDWVPPAGTQVKALREGAGFTLQQMADLFNMNYRSWQAKESDGKFGRSLTYAEHQYFLLMCDKHPELKVTPR